MQKSAKIGITGIGMICAIGNNPGEVLASLRGGSSGIGPVRYLHTAHSELPVGEVKLSNDGMASLLGLEKGRQYSRTALMGAISIRQALSQARIGSVAGRRLALVCGTTVGGMDVAELSQKTAISNECGRSTVEMAEYAGIAGARCCTVSTACSSALNSIMVGCEMLMRDEADVVIAGGSEALSRFHLNGFNTLMILDKDRCRPFDAGRAGLNLGEGAAFVVLQKEPAGALAFIAGYGNRCDAYHQTATSENGEGAFLAMSDALAMAAITPSQVDYINAHGTGTQDNDISESRAILRLFGTRVPPVSSTKAFTGHTTSASGSIETAICILAMQNRFIPANLGWSLGIEGGITPSSGAEDVTLDKVLCNSFGFGGNDSSLLISASESSIPCPEMEFRFEVAADVEVNDPDELGALKEYVSPMESRRMTSLLKAATLSALRALKMAGIDCPDAIITGTANGMLESSNRFLEDIAANGEELLKPTLFMQSTHNTIGSSIAIRTKCHGYNITYSHGGDSLEWALLDAGYRIRTGKAASVLVGSYDETSDGGVCARTLILKRK